MADEHLSASYRARLRAYRYDTAAFKIDDAWKARTQPRTQFQTSSSKSHPTRALIGGTCSRRSLSERPRVIFL